MPRRALPSPPERIGPVGTHLAQTYRIIELNLENCVQKGQDYEVGQARIILTSPDGSRFILTVDNAGNLSTTPL